MRNGLLRAALAAALLLVVPAPAVAADPGLTISLPPTSGGILAIPYTSTVGGDLITVDLREPGAADFVRSVRDPVRPSGTLHAFFYPHPARVLEGEWGVRVTVWSGGQELARVEGVTQLDWQASIAVAAPYFGEVPVGMTTGVAKLRIENFSWGPLRIRSVQTPAGSELTIVEDGCSGRTLYGLDGCYMSLTFTPTAVGQRRGTLVVDANAATKEVYTLGVGVPVPPEPPLALAPAPEPTQNPAPQPIIEAPPEPELTFGAHPGRTTTRLFGLRIDDVPAGSTVTVRCTGTCATKTYTKRGASGTVSLQRFAKRALKAGTRLRVTLATPGRPTRTVTVTVRARREPRVSGSLAR